jgi:PAS domain-containing protein
MQETRLRLHLALGAARMSTWDATVVDSRVIEGVITWSADGAALIGLPPVEQEQTFPDFLARIHPDERDYLLDYMQLRVSQGSPYHIEYRVLMPDGLVRWIGCRGMAVYEDGIPVRTLGLVWDDTPRKQQEAELAEQKELAEVTLGSIGDGVIATDARTGQSHQRGRPRGGYPYRGRIRRRPGNAGGGVRPRHRLRPGLRGRPVAPAALIAPLRCAAVHTHAHVLRHYKYAS